jgi:hypothetical protein
MGRDISKQSRSMRVGVIEIMETGHIVLAETLCRIFCYDPRNQVFLFTIEKHSENLKHLCDRYPNLKLVVNPSKNDTEIFLKKVDDLHLDRVYIVTLIKYFRELSKWKINASLFLIVHNLDEWFNLSFSEGFRKFIYNALKNHHLKTLIYFFKVNFIYPGYKKRILDKVKQTCGHLVVLSEAIRKELLKINTDIPVDVIPFCVYDPPELNSSDETNPEKPLKICVPGILSQYRRDYLGLLDLIENQLSAYKTRFSVDFLGGVYYDNPLDNSNLIIDRVEQLKSQGFSIIVHPVQFIPLSEYDHELSESDIILGNMNVVLNKFSIYGKTKEAGQYSSMIKGAKPGILPDSYVAPEELSSSIVLFHDFQEIGRILIDLINNRQMVESLKKKALENSRHFSPDVIYNQLIEEH